MRRLECTPPTALGEIPIAVAPATATSTTVGVINAIILTEHDPNTGARTANQNEVATADEAPDPLADYINVSPNPVVDHLNLEISSSLPLHQSYSIEFTDMRGIQVYTLQVESRDGGNYISERISADFMQSGLYIMTIRSRESGVRYFKVAKK